MKRRVAVVFGGRSAEHEISVLSARSVIDALDPDRYEVLAIGVTKEGRWELLPAGPPALPGASPETLADVAPGSGTEIALDQEPGAQALVSGDGSRTPIDVVFPVMHGPYGEDGSIQGFLEMAGAPYVGAGVLASAVGMDKAVQKVLFAAAGSPACRTRWCTSATGRRIPTPSRRAPPIWATRCSPSRRRSGPRSGSSGSTTRRDCAGPWRRPSGLAARRCSNARPPARASSRSRCWGTTIRWPRSLARSSLGVTRSTTSRPSTSTTRRAGSGRRPAGTLEDLQRLAVAAFRAIDGAGMARVDFFLLQDGLVLVNEVNTIPGFTGISMYPRLWEASGLPYPELVDRLIELAIERHEAERNEGTGV